MGPGVCVRRRISIALVSGAMLPLTAVPATNATAATTIASQVHTFGIPGIYGISAWGSYVRMPLKVRLTVCVKDISRAVYGGAAAAVAFTADYRHRQALTATVIGAGRTGCATTITSYAGHLVVDAVSGYSNGKIRQVGKVRQIY
jgi:hypothetical protein